MNSHFDLTDEQFEQTFANCTFVPELFTHEAHIRLAWIHLKNYGEKQAIENICGQLQQFVAFLGVQDKYNETLTVAAIKAVKHFMGKTKAQDFARFIEQNSRLNYNFKELMAQHYGFDIFNSAEAKTTYLEPDLLPF